jgi:hypothetical protein
MNNSDNLLLGVMRDPWISGSFDRTEWDLCLRQARHARILARLCVLLDQARILPTVPPKVHQHLEAARTVADQHERILRWEVNRLEQALGPLRIPVILLKGAAYVLAALPPAGGRLYSDVDILVPKEHLALVESTLLRHGWQVAKLDKYDQRYYRKWMHELPPLTHKERGTMIDLHHNILPETGRLHPNPQALLEAARPVAGTIFSILAPADMVLHSAAHMFQDGELGGSLRDLADLDGLLRHFGKDIGFWDGFVSRGRQLDLSRPMFYALRYAQQFFETPVPQTVMADAMQYAPAAAILSLMDSLVRRALIPVAPDCTPWDTDLARWLLYVRSHWLRMPPLLLARHLFKKALRRFDAKDA